VETGMAIRNRDALAAVGDGTVRRTLLAMADEALDALNTEPVIRRLVRFDGQTLHVGRRSWEMDDFGRVFVIGAGKAANAMARAMENVLGGRIDAGIVVVKSFEPGDGLNHIELPVGGHPYPNEDGWRATRRILDLVDDARPGDLFIGLLSGGSSALMNCPQPGISIDDEASITRQLLTAGARILEVNAVRRHISAVNGGRVAQRIERAGAEMINLIVSDLVGDPNVGTPEVPGAYAGTQVGIDLTTFADAWQAIEKYGLNDSAPASVLECLGRGTPETETPKAFGGRIANFVIQGVVDGCDAAVAAATRHGLPAHVLTVTLEGESREAGVFLGAIAREVRERGRPFAAPCVLIASGETTTRIDGACGLGGPAQELALGFAREVAGLGGVAIAAIETEGTDGPTGLAGGVTDSTSLERAAALGIDLADALTRHDAGSALTAIGDQLVTGNTGTNVCDLNIIFIA
jgi:glycerate 2-kinase